MSASRERIRPEYRQFNEACSAVGDVVPLTNELYQIPGIHRIIGGKGEGLSESLDIKLPVPSAFIITTKVWEDFVRHDYNITQETCNKILGQVDNLEAVTGQKFGDRENPLFVSVRSSPVHSMPGILKTVLNVGINDETVEALANQIGPVAAWEAYYRLIENFGTAFGIDQDEFAKLKKAKRGERVGPLNLLSEEEIKELVTETKQLYYNQLDNDFEQDPISQLLMASYIVFASWDTAAAEFYRQEFDIPYEDGTAIIGQKQIFGNVEGGGSGIVISKDPKNSEKGPIVAFIPSTQGTAVVGQTVHSQQNISSFEQPLKAQLEHIIITLNKHSPLSLEAEYAYDGKQVWVVQKREVSLSTISRLQYVLSQIEIGDITEHEGLIHFTPLHLKSLLIPPLNEAALRQARRDGRLIGQGQTIALGHNTAGLSRSIQEAAATDNEVILVCLLRENTMLLIPDNVVGIGALNAGIGSHNARRAEQLARDRGIPVVFGLKAIPDSVKSGQLVTLNGDSGELFIGEIPLETANERAGLINGEQKAIVQDWLDQWQRNPWFCITAEEEFVRDRIDMAESQLALARKQGVRSHKAFEHIALSALFPPDIRQQYNVVDPKDHQTIREMLSSFIGQGYEATIRTCHIPHRPAGGPWALISNHQDVDRLFTDTQYSKHGNFEAMIQPLIAKGTKYEVTEVLVGRIPKDKLNPDPEIQRQHCTWTQKITPDGIVVTQIHPFSSMLRDHEEAPSEDIITYSVGPGRLSLSPGDRSHLKTVLHFGEKLMDHPHLDKFLFIINQLKFWRLDYFTTECLAALSSVFPPPKYGIPVLEGQARIDLNSQYSHDDPSTWTRERPLKWMLTYGIKIL